MFSFMVSDHIVMVPISCHYPYILIMREKYPWLLKYLYEKYQLLISSDYNLLEHRVNTF